VIVHDAPRILTYNEGVEPWRGGGELLAAPWQVGRMVVERLFGLSAEGVASNAPPDDAKGLPCSLIVFN
jgi:hypothetical protein